MRSSLGKPKVLFDFKFDKTYSPFIFSILGSYFPGPGNYLLTKIFKNDFKNEKFTSIYSKKILGLEKIFYFF